MPHTETIKQTERPPTWGASEMDLTRDQSAFAQKKGFILAPSIFMPSKYFRAHKKKKRERKLSVSKQS